MMKSSSTRKAVQRRDQEQDVPPKQTKEQALNFGNILTIETFLQGRCFMLVDTESCITSKCCFNRILLTIVKYC